MIALLWGVAGLVVMIGGVELLVRGGSRVAARPGIPPLVIGLTAEERVSTRIAVACRHFAGLRTGRSPGLLDDRWRHASRCSGGRRLFVSLALVVQPADAAGLTSVRLPFGVMHCAGHIAYWAVVGTAGALAMHP